MNANELFQAGDLQGAIAAATADLKAKPTDVAQRLFLAELLWFNGQLDRVEKQLETISMQTTQSAMTLALYRQILRGEVAREQVLREGRTPEIVTELPADAKSTLEALLALRLGQHAEAARLLAQAESERQPVSGTCNGRPFNEFRDLDDRVAGVLEVITSTGKYYWVPWQNVESLEMEPPKVPLDLIYRRTQIEVIGGPSGEVHIPTRYVAAKDEQLDDALQLGRATDWIGEDGELVQGRGLRTLLVGDDDVSIMEIETLSFTKGGPMSRIRPDQYLLPSVFDRLLDDDPDSQVEAPQSRAQLLRELKHAVRRDLENLLNTRICLYPIPDDLPELKKSVLNYGIPDFTGLSMGSREQRDKLRQLVEEAILCFETRFVNVRVEVASQHGSRRAVDRTIHFRIEGLLYAEPAPEPVTFDSQLRPQLGDFEVRAVSG